MKSYRVFSAIYSIFNIAMMVIGVLILLNMIEMNAMLAVVMASYGMLNIIIVTYRAKSKGNDIQNKK